MAGIERGGIAEEGEMKSNRETKGKGHQNTTIMTMLMMRINKLGCLTKRTLQAHTSMITTPRIMEEETGGGIDSRALQVPMTVLR